MEFALAMLVGPLIMWAGFTLGQKTIPVIHYCENCVCSACYYRREEEAA